MAKSIKSKLDDLKLREEKAIRLLEETRKAQMDLISPTKIKTMVVVEKSLERFLLENIEKLGGRIDSLKLEADLYQAFEKNLIKEIKSKEVESIKVSDEDKLGLG